MTEDFMFSKFPDKTYVEWKILDIFEQCQKKDFILNSPQFSLCGAKWHLRAYFKPQCKEPLSGWLDLYLNKETYSKEHISCRIGIKKAGMEVKSFNFECKSGSEENTWDMTDFIELKEDFNDQTSKRTSDTGFSFGASGSAFSEFKEHFNDQTSVRTSDTGFSFGASSSAFSELREHVNDKNSVRTSDTVFGFGKSNSAFSFGKPVKTPVCAKTDRSLTVFCYTNLQDSNTVPSSISSSNGKSNFNNMLKKTENFIISKSPDKTYVEWTIQDIFEQCRKKDFILNSPPFSLCDSKWHLKAYVKPQCKLPLSGWLDLYLNKETYPTEHCISGKIGIKKAGMEVKSFNFECRSGYVENTWGMTDFIELKEDFNDQMSVRTPDTVVSFGASSSASSELKEDISGQTSVKMSDTAFSFGTSSSAFVFGKPAKTPVCEKSDRSLTVFCYTNLQAANTVPSSISSSNGGETFSKNIKDFYINKRYTDVKIEVKDKTFFAHKCMLAAHSAVFASMFDHDMEQKNTENVKITDCDPDFFQEFLLFLYSGKLDILSSNNAISLYKIADKYNVEELMEECVRYMIRKLSVDSFCDVLHFATLHNKADLLTAIRKFFNDNVKTILPTPKWQTFLKEHPLVVNELLIKFVDKKRKFEDCR